MESQCLTLVYTHSGAGNDVWPETQHQEEASLKPGCWQPGASGTGCANDGQSGRGLAAARGHSPHSTLNIYEILLGTLGNVEEVETWKRQECMRDGEGNPSVLQMGLLSRHKSWPVVLNLGHAENQRRSWQLSCLHRFWFNWSGCTGIWAFFFFFF